MNEGAIALHVAFVRWIDRLTLITLRQKVHVELKLLRGGVSPLRFHGAFLLGKCNETFLHSVSRASVSLMRVGPL